MKYYIVLVLNQFYITVRFYLYFRKGSIIATFRMVFKETLQISDSNLVVNALKVRINSLSNSYLVKEGVAFFVEPNSILIQGTESLNNHYTTVIILAI